MAFLNRTEVADSGIGDVLFAGVGSTAAGILAVLYEVATQPQWQDQLHLELNTMGGNISPPSNSRLSTLPILQAVIKESLRLHPPFAGPFERVIGPGGESSIPKLAPLPMGTRIWSSQHVICRSAQIFESPDDFRPERWLTSSQDRLKQMDDAYFVFGRGSRGCIGKRLGLMVIEQTVAAVSVFLQLCQDFMFFNLSCVSDKAFRCYVNGTYAADSDVLKAVMHLKCNMTSYSLALRPAGIPKRKERGGEFSI